VIVHGEAPDTLAPALRDALAALEHDYADRGFALLGPRGARRGRGRRGRAGRSAGPARAGHRAARRDRPATAQKLAELPQPFTAGEAREALGTSRKVIVPLLEHFAREGVTRRSPDGRHTVTGR
jgi:hypothetical protein